MLAVQAFLLHAVHLCGLVAIIKRIPSYLNQEACLVTLRDRPNMLSLAPIEMAIGS